AAKMADRVAKLRIFNDSEGKMNLALGDLEPPGSVLAVSNFTLYGETAKNRRPSFIESAPYDRGNELYEAFIHALRGLGVHVESGVFGAMMDVELVNDGPVTVILET
ncbi:MAG: D-aminoacyl-tRNA deacylase, partial [Fimbriimonadales bacterium]